MHFRSLTVRNYKSFGNPAQLLFQPGMNVVLGRNSSGKSAMLEVLSLALNPVPHRSSVTVPTRDSNPSGQTVASIDVTLEVGDLRTLPENANLTVPIPVAESELARSLRLAQPGGDERFRDWLHSNPLTISLPYDNGWRGVPTVTSYPTLNNGADPRTPSQFLLYDLSRIRLPEFTQIRTNSLPSSSESWHKYLAPKVYLFRSARMATFSPNLGIDEMLQPDGSNLTAVLDLLQRKPHEFQNYNSLLSQILPEIQHVSVKLTSPGMGEVAIWMHDPRTGRDDLAVPLSQTGSGVPHVLGMLYVFVSEPNSIMLIDEPQSFLHPGAVRKLMEVFKSSTKHQCVVTTHSPTVVAASDTSSMTLLRLVNGQTEAKLVDTEAVREVQGCLKEVGASFADIFGPERVLWVEGPTEEECFPMIVRAILKKPLLGVIVRGVVSTGELEAKRTRRVFEVYEKLSEGAAIFPVSVGYVFDDEVRSPDIKRDLEKTAPGRVKFLPRRMYENYLLIPTAIANVLSDYDRSHGRSYSGDEVQAWIDGTGHLPKYGTPPQFDPNRPWLQYVDAATLLADLFSTMTDTRVSYDKKRHSVKLTQRILETEPTQLEELSHLLKEILKL
jgi:predicted ATPase